MPLEKERRARQTSRPARSGAAKRGRGAGGCTPATLDVLQAKLRPPAIRPGVVARPALVNSLRRGGARVVKVVAPAGWGKTTLAAQWTSAEQRPCVWLSVDAHDNDALVLLKHVVAGISRVTTVEPRLLAALAGPRPAELRVLLARTGKVLRSCSKPLLLVVDNVDLLDAADARRVLLMLVADAPPGSAIALLARVEPRLPPAELRTHGKLRELTTTELALSDKDAEVVLQTGHAELPAAAVADVVHRFEGWPAGLYLASLALVDDAAGGPDNLLVGSDRYLADYMRSEYLTRLRPRELRFVERTSILEHLNAAACDALLQRNDSAAELKRLARLQLTFPDGDTPGRYRYPWPLREFLTRELDATEPRVVPSLHRRAADWYLKHGDPESALEHAQAAGDPARVAFLLPEMALPGSTPSRMRIVERAFVRFDETYPLEQYPNVAVHGSWIHAFRGRTAQARRWLTAAERGLRRRPSEAATLRPRIAVVNAALCRRGPSQMLADAGAAVGKLQPRSPWHAAALHMRGCAALLLGAADEADALLATAVASPAAAPETRMIALAQLSFLARDRDDAAGAEQFAEQASMLALALDGAPTTAIAFAASAGTALRQGSWADARDLVRTAAGPAAGVTDALPWLAITTRLELAQCYLTLKDVESARALVEQIDSVLDLQPRVGVLVDGARSLRHEASVASKSETESAGLTPAELRLVPLLATHLSFREIADELHVSRNTVKTQAISIYRKLGVSGRSDALAAAKELGVRPAARA
jgi:LuxR family transcriptional regulator, maltose regulon positive regulatory protein